MISTDIKLGMIVGVNYTIEYRWFQVVEMNDEVVRLREISKGFYCNFSVNLLKDGFNTPTTLDEFFDLVDSPYYDKTLGKEEEKPKNMFKVGNRVVRVEQPFGSVFLTPNKIYTITEVYEDSDIQLIDDIGFISRFDADKFELAPELVKEEAPAYDTINKAQHYNQDIKIEPIDYIQANNMGFCAGNVVKYITRYKLKGTPKQDLEKAKYYIQRLIDELEEES